MAASITDKFNKAGDGNGAYPVVARVSTTRTAGEAVLTCEDLTGWATDTPVHFSTYRLTQTGTVDTTTQTDWKGIVSGNTITNLTRIAGAEDTGSLIGDIVELNPTIGWLDDIITGLLVSHTQTGALKDGAVKTATIADSAVTSAKIADGTIAAGDLASNAVTTAKITDLNVTTGKLANGAVTGVSNSATAIGSAKLALATVGTPNLRDGAVAEGKIAGSAVSLAKLKRTVLYNNTTGTNGTVTLSETAANFTEMEIFFYTTDNGNNYNSVKVYSPNGKRVLLLSANFSSNSGSVKGAFKLINGTSITTQQYGDQIQEGTASSYKQDNYPRIVRVVGYK